jgi:hypothetical protein
MHRFPTVSHFFCQNLSILACLRSDIAAAARCLEQFSMAKAATARST